MGEGGWLLEPSSFDIKNIKELNGIGVSFYQNVVY